MHSFFEWLYARRRNYLLATTLVYALPMYMLVLVLKDDSSWIVDLVFLLFTIAGSLAFSLGMWFAVGKGMVERRDARGTNRQ